MRYLQILWGAGRRPFQSPRQRACEGCLAAPESATRWQRTADVSSEAASLFLLSYALLGNHVAPRSCALAQAQLICFLPGVVCTRRSAHRLRACFASELCLQIRFSFVMCLCGMFDLVRAGWLRACPSTIWLMVLCGHFALIGFILLMNCSRGFVTRRIRHVQLPWCSSHIGADDVFVVCVSSMSCVS